MENMRKGGISPAAQRRIFDALRKALPVDLRGQDEYILPLALALTSNMALEIAKSLYGSSSDDDLIRIALSLFLANAITQAITNYTGLYGPRDWQSIIDRLPSLWSMVPEEFRPAAPTAPAAATSGRLH